MSPSAGRLLLLLPTTTYRTEAFVAAAGKLGVELVCASERPSTFEPLAPDSLVTLDFADPGASASNVLGRSEAHTSSTPSLVAASTNASVR